ncbi:MAG: hypothetical protein ACLGGW_05835, partial [Gammaproteobacteria bacterium]
TLEHAGAIKYKHFLIENPWHMVIDLLDMRLDNTLKDLTSRLHPEDLMCNKFGSDNTMRTRCDWCSI